MRTTDVLLVSVAVCLACVSAYRPVVIVHGLADNVGDFTGMIGNITSAHPGTEVHIPALYQEEFSFVPLWDQLPAWVKHVTDISKNATDGINLICTSQGNMICRAILETVADHNVNTYIGLAGPHLGQYGDTSFLHFLPNATREFGYLYFYTEEGQHTISVANYWHDPRFPELYLEDNIWLPQLNVLNGSSINATTAAFYKENFLKLDQVVLIGGPDDGVITPWQSSIMQFYADGSGTVVRNMTEESVYVDDTFGLRTLDEAGKLERLIFPGVIHEHWRLNMTVFNEGVLPYLN